jgi:(E)-4-hydroxy-3-methylbut-2-enyl-diphosphate synthase
MPRYRKNLNINLFKLSRDLAIMRNSPVVRVRDVKIGGDNPVVIQSMTNTDTEDIDATVKQILELYDAGSRLVRVTVNTRKAAGSITEIRNQIGNVPLIGDFHFNGHILLKEYLLSAEALDKIRINPGTSDKKEEKENFYSMLSICRDLDKPIRIGVNGGSLDPWILDVLMEKNAKLSVPESSDDVRLQAIVESAFISAQTAMDHGIPREKIILSAKTSNAIDLIRVYRTLANDPRGPYALHLGLTEAGMGNEGIVRSIAALSPLLLDGIGDTIRISLTPVPGEKRTLEVEVAKKLLQDLGLASYAPTTTACPGCGRTTSTDFQVLTRDTQEYVSQNLEMGFTIRPGSQAAKVCGHGMCSEWAWRIQDGKHGCKPTRK